MEAVVISAHEPYTVGEIVNIPMLRDCQMQPHFNVRALILREATEQEWRDFVSINRGQVWTKPPDFIKFQ
jgi:hypothetical protein